MQVRRDLNCKASRHRADLFKMSLPCRIAYDLSEKGEKVEKPEDDTDRSGSVANDGRHPEAEHGDKAEVENGPNRGAKSRRVTEGEEPIAVSNGETLAC